MAEAVRRADPDIATFQEAINDSETDHAGIVRGAGAGLGHSVWSPRRPPASPGAGESERSTIGLAVVSRWPVTRRVEVPLPDVDGTATRTALGIVVAHPRGPLPLVTTHLDSHPARSALRSEQLRVVTELVVDLMGLGDHLAPVVTGDLNAEPQSDEVRRFLGLQTAGFVKDLAFQDAWRMVHSDDPGWTWRRDNPHVAAGNPDARIDYVAIGLAGRVGTARLVGADDGAGWPSDHAGVVADLRP